MSFAKSILAASLGLVLISTPAAQAQQSASAAAPGEAPEGGCFSAPADLSDAEVGAFLANPDAILATYPDDGLALSLEVRGLAGSDASTILPLVQLSDGANATEINSIAAGLARAAEACLASRPDIAEYIQLLIATSGFDDLLVAFAAASEDVSVAALPGSDDVPGVQVISASAIGDTDGAPSESDGAGGGSGGGDGGFSGGGGGGGGATSGGGARGDVSPASP